MLLNATRRSWKGIIMVIMVLALDRQGILGRKFSDPDFSKKKIDFFFEKIYFFFFGSKKFLGRFGHGKVSKS